MYEICFTEFNKFFKIWNLFTHIRFAHPGTKIICPGFLIGHCGNIALSIRCSVYCGIMQKHRNFVRSKSNICLDCFIAFCNCSSERGKCILRCSCFVPAMSDQISIWSRNRCRSCSRYRCRCWHCYCFLLHSLYLNNTGVFLLILPCRCYPDSSALFPLNNSCR